MALIRWEPVPVNRLFNSLFDTPTAAGGTRRWLPATDLIESESHYVLRADLPGVSEDDITVQLTDGVLTVSGERKSEHEETSNGYRRVERTSGSFRRSVRVPKGVDAEAITAGFDKGVLEVSIPKPERVQPHTVQITVGSGEAKAIESPVESSEAGEPAAA